MRMKALAVLAALVTLVVACAVPVSQHRGPQQDGCNRTFIVSSDFTEDEHEAIYRAIDRWNAIALERFCAVDGTAQKAATTNRGVFRIVYGSPHWKSISDSHGGADVLGVHYGTTDQIGIVDVLGADLFEAVALHEFGHAHGLGHTPAPSIMHGGAGTAYEFTLHDMAECQRVGACQKEDQNGGE